jgi:hypothetical protein
MFTRSGLAVHLRCIVIARRKSESAHITAHGQVKGAKSWVILNGAEIGKLEDSMKKALFQITMTAMLALGFLAASQPARAQERLVANVPFAFTVGKMILPAGEYQVQNWTDGSVMLLIQATDRSASTFVASHAVESNKRHGQCKLIFHQYGGRYFLSQIWVGESRGRELPKSAEEKEALLAHNEKPNQVAIVASLVAPRP